MIPETPLDLESIRARLESFLEQEVGSPLQIEELRPLAGGASRAIYRFSLRSPHPSPGSSATRLVNDEREPLPARTCVLRLDLGGEIYASALSRREEFAVLEAAFDAGCSVPRVLWLCEDEAVLGRPFFVMEHLEGETIGRRIVRRADLAAARARLPQEMARELARIHAIGASRLAFLPRPEPLGANGTPHAFLTVIARARRELAQIDEPHPALELGLAWLEANAPAEAEHVLVHGDFRLGNLVVGEEGLAGVLDWEFAAVSDAHEDLAWPFVRDWRFGNDHLRFAGISDGEAFLRAYEEASGRSIDRRRLALWEALGNLRWALGCLTQARRHLRGEEPSVELASLGRRAAEMELEMLDSIARIATGRRRGPEANGGATGRPEPEGAKERPETQPADGDTRVSSVHDAPDADALLESVQSFLLREVASSASDARLRFRTLVAANVLAILRRELAAGDVAAARERRDWLDAFRSIAFGSIANPDSSLEELLEADLRTLRERARDLVRDGSVPPVPHDAIWRAARAALVRKLEVDNPEKLMRLEEDAR